MADATERIEWDGSDHQASGYALQCRPDDGPVRGLAVHALAMSMLDRYRRIGRLTPSPALDPDDFLRS